MPTSNRCATDLLFPMTSRSTRPWTASGITRRLRQPKGGTYTYRVTEQHMPSDGALRAGPPLTVDIPLDMVIYDDFLDVGFARNYASSQAYNEKYQGNPNVIPVNADDGLKFKKVPGDVYEWLDSRLTI